MVYKTPSQDIRLDYIIQNTLAGDKIIQDTIQGDLIRLEYTRHPPRRLDYIRLYNTPSKEITNLIYYIILYKTTFKEIRLDKIVQDILPGY